MSRSWTVEPRAYTYWNQKPQFLLDRDVYDYWTVFAVEQGTFQYKLGEREGEAEFGDLVVCPPGLVFGRRTVTPLTFHFVQFVWEEEPSETERGLLTGKLSVGDRARLLSTYAYLRRYGELRMEEPAANRRFRHMLNDLWMLIEPEKEEKVREGGEQADPVMDKARHWLKEHAYAPFSMRALSERLGLTPVQFTRRFHASFRMNPSEFVAGLRMERACRLLGETRLSLDAIAQQCGYENGFYLSRVFRKQNGMSPSLYRRLHQV